MSNSQKTKQTKSNKDNKSKNNDDLDGLGMNDDYLVIKPEKWTSENIRKFIIYAGILTFIPMHLFLFVFNHTPFNIINLIAYIITFIPNGILLIWSYIPVYINYDFKIQCSIKKKDNKNNDSNIKLRVISWTIFYVNIIYLGSFMLTNFYIFKNVKMQFRMPLATLSASFITYNIIATFNP